MNKYAIYQDGEWLKDVEAGSEREALTFDPLANRAVLISEQDEMRER